MPSEPVEQAPRTALLLPGQGSQRPQMGRPWRDTPQWRLVEQADAQVEVDLPRLLLEAGAEELRRTDVAQLCLHVVGLMALDAVTEQLTPRAVCGHSLGEYTALVAAGVLSVADSVRLVAARGAAMLAACAAQPGAMAALLGASDDAAERACAGLPAWPATYNAPGHVVISGTSDGVRQAGVRSRDLGVRRVLPLPVGGAFHTPLMTPALPGLQAALDATAFAPPRVTVLSNVDGQAHDDGWPDLLARQLLAPVRWASCLAALPALGVQRVVECGPGGVLTALARRVDGLTAVAVSTPGDVAALA